MDYVVGSVAALITGNVTPNRPKLIRRALTPTKHQQSPNVTPKSELVDDRSIFLSPSLQKKKAIVKKSPKRIFENPDLDVTENSDSNSSLQSPKAEKAKKHLQNELETDDMAVKGTKNKKSGGDLNKSTETVSPQKTSKSSNNRNSNENNPKKNKRKTTLAEEVIADVITKNSPNISKADTNKEKSSQKLVQRRKSIVDVSENTDTIENTEDSEKNIDEEPKLQTDNANGDSAKKKNKKRKKKGKNQDNEDTLSHNTNDVASEPVEEEDSPNKANLQTDTANCDDLKKKNKKHKKKSKSQTELETVNDNGGNETTDVPAPEDSTDDEEEESSKPKKVKKVNPNAITTKDSDSEHESDNEIESENEQINNEILKTEEPESSDEEEEEEKKKPAKKEEKPEVDTNSEEEIMRTLFVGNVPFSGKCKKEIKKIFSKYGQIQTIRIRTIPVKDARVTPKLAVIKNELHPDRSTVNVYIKFAEPESVEKALVENNTVVRDHHLRVSRSASSGAAHDPRHAVFVGNLPFALEDEALRERFRDCGEIHSVRIIRDKKTNAGKGFGYVNFTSKDGVELALAMSEEDLTIKNRILRVKRCTLTTNKTGNKPPHGQNRGPPNNNFSRDNQNRGQNPRNNNQLKSQGFRKRNQFEKPQGRFGGRQEDGNDGAQRRIMNKRKMDGGGEGPPDKRQRNINQPNKEKKPRKEFVGMTAEKKKKRKFDKGQKKKKALSEILTK